MWKFVTRGIRETLERRTCRTNVYSQSSQDNTKNEVKNNLTCNHKFLAPNFCALTKDFYGSAKSNSTKDKNHKFNWNTKYTWTEAVGWSSVLAIGWVVCQTLCFRRRLFEKEQYDSVRSKPSQYPDARFPHLFSHVLNLRPKHILPVTNCAGNNNDESSEGNSETEWTADKPFGPITVDEALKQAKEDFAIIDKLTVGEFELRCGLIAVEQNRYKDAIKHFIAGAKYSSPASMFNLGLCYELGLGTLADQAKAAKYYSDAAEKGHAEATYNLGVFHAQGRGGFSVDSDRARRYFIKAAKLGQSQAQHALDLEKRHYEAEKKISNMIFTHKRENTAPYIKNNKNGNYVFNEEFINYNNMFNTHFSVDSLENSDHEQSSIVAKNSTEIFLDILNAKEPNIFPVQADSINYNVPR